MKEQDAWLVLNAVPGLGSGRIRLLAGHFGSANAVLEGTYEELAGCGIITPHTARNIVHFPKDKFLGDEYNLVQCQGVRVLTAADEDFPQSLLDIPDAPVVLYVKGDARLLYAGAVALVGSRVSSHYGRSTAERFAAAFAQAGLVVVSGLARGIDTAAHRGCLDAGGKTVAVLGCGLAHVYPKENSALLAAIIQNGAAVSELPLGTPPLPLNFPRRNRIITGLSAATVVVEAGEKSGALISAVYAAEQGKDVFAVPANVDHETAAGSNRLIKDGVRVALSPLDVLEEIKGSLQMAFPAVLAETGAARVTLTDGEMGFYQCLSSEPVHIDELLTQANRPPHEAAQAMLNLELKGVVRQLPGKYYVKI